MKYKNQQHTDKERRITDKKAKEMKNKELGSVILEKEKRKNEKG